MRFADELGFWITLAMGVALFTAGFIPLFKIVVGRLPGAGLKEALGASA